ncbi:hypothetical protein PMAYCL1PPCAC_29878, partial [Pristionchus mayeri]
PLPSLPPQHPSPLPTIVQSDPLLISSRPKRLEMYKKEDGNLFKEFPQLEKNTNIMLADSASSMGKTLEEITSENDALWENLTKIKDHIRPGDLIDCKAKVAAQEDPDALSLLCLIAYLNGSRKNGSLTRVNRVYYKLNVSSPSDAITHLREMWMVNPLVLSSPFSSSLFLSFDSCLIPVEGGLRTAILSIVSSTHLFNLSIHSSVGDIIRFFYHAAGLSLPRVPVAVVKALKLIQA